MIFEDKRLVAGLTGALLLAAGGGFAVARLTADSASSAEQPTKEEAETAHGVLTLSAEAIGNAGIGVEEIRAGGLGSEIIAQGMVVPSPTGEALVTARAGGAVTRVFKRLGDPVAAGEPLAIVESRDAGQIAAERTAAAARARLAPSAPDLRPVLCGPGCRRKL